VGNAVTRLLWNTLKVLEEHDFQKFKRELSKIQPKEGYERIELESVAGLSPAALATLLYSHYGRSHCVEVTVEVLRAIGQVQQAEHLLDMLQTAPGSGECPALTRASDHSPIPGLHFVEQHREQLIQRVTSVSPVLDQLYGHVLTNEQYQSIRGMPTPQEQMRLLYSFMPSWDVACKDLFLDALKKTNNHLLQDLQGQ
uniref:PYD and CARD domain containing n=1 Tax=Meleagris gallopavo TaxID=9103 RepID=A0A803Y9Q4_MELGA